jgi:hypothetical protein
MHEGRVQSVKFCADYTTADRHITHDFAKPRATINLDKALMRVYACPSAFWHDEHIVRKTFKIGPACQLVVMTSFAG